MGHLVFEATGAQPGCLPFLIFITEVMGQGLRCPGSCRARGDPGSSPALPLRGVSSVSKEGISQSESQILQMMESQLQGQL